MIFLFEYGLEIFIKRILHFICPQHTLSTPASWLLKPGGIAMLPNKEYPMAQYQKQLVSKKELKTLCGIPYSAQHIARLAALIHHGGETGWRA
jgi:hypothetical protein